MEKIILEWGKICMVRDGIRMIGAFFSYKNLLRIALSMFWKDAANSAASFRGFTASSYSPTLLVLAANWEPSLKLLFAIVFIG
ncbi:TPA: hypothetical protein ACQ717_004143 [Escherichia coli]